MDRAPSGSQSAFVSNDHSHSYGNKKKRGLVTGGVGSAFRRVLPGPFNYRLFRVKGESMSPTIRPNSFVIGKDIKDSKLAKYDIVVSKDRRVLKRIYGVSKNKAHLVGDNDSDSSEHIIPLNSISHLVIWPKF